MRARRPRTHRVRPIALRGENVVALTVCASVPEGILMIFKVSLAAIHRCNDKVFCPPSAPTVRNSSKRQPPTCGRSGVAVSVKRARVSLNTSEIGACCLWAIPSHHSGKHIRNNRLIPCGESSVPSLAVSGRVVLDRTIVTIAISFTFRVPQMVCRRLPLHEADG
jgi:hypothetical protein